MTVQTLTEIRRQLRSSTLGPEDAALLRLRQSLDMTEERRKAIVLAAAGLIRKVRADSDPKLMESFLATYGLSTKEGVALMCLAEALLRVPDNATIDDLIADKITPHDWRSHAGDSSSIFVNASTWGLMLTGKILDDGEGAIERTLRGMVRRLGEPVIRKAVAAAMREMGEQFVLGRTIKEAVERGQPMLKKNYLYSYDMLGEAARTDADALRYLKAYEDAILALRPHSKGSDIRKNPGISVKLSAIHPRYEVGQKGTMMPVMVERLLGLCQAAKEAQMGLNIDAEEADRLDLSLDIIEETLSHPSLAGWDGFGVVVQAYGLRASYAIDWLYQLAVKLDRKIMVRLVKGAYWDTEVKRAQTMGLEGYPVFTRKVNTDVSYMANAQKLLGYRDRIYPQFATHNAHTIATILEMAEDRDSFEFQRLHGMGESLHEIVRKQENTRTRIYAPVGAHEDLLAYLVRRLLENGANSSFVHQITDEDVSPEEIARDPVAEVERQGDAHNPALPMPRDIFGKGRKNSQGWDLTEVNILAALEEKRGAFLGSDRWTAKPLTRAAGYGKARKVLNPAIAGEVVGTVHEATADMVPVAIKAGLDAFPAWTAKPAAERAAILSRAADLYEKNAVEFFALATREAGKSVTDGIAEVREAVDFLRYYAAEAGRVEAGTQARGLIVCISPWNFPLAIFTGQIAAALVTGNTVIAKPAEQTPLIAARAVELLREAGIPADVLQLLPGDGPSVGQPLTADPRISGVCFTGSTEVAKLIEKQLAKTASPDAMLIAETGGLNAMIVDSTALPEQAVRDIVASAFQSAGQRCSALRMLYVQKDVEKKIVDMLKGALDVLEIDDPWKLSSDVGPVIDEEAQRNIIEYCAEQEVAGRLIHKVKAPSDGLFVAPHVLRLSGIEELRREIFGPVLHIATFEAEELDKVIAAINAKGFGLTFGLHTRIDARVQEIVDGVHVGNIYVNRNQIGAVVGSQPFGGEGLSGTGPKAGGPNYLRRFRKSETVESNADAAPVTAQQLNDNLPGEKAASDWAMRGDRISVLRKHLRGKGAEAIGAAARLDFGPIDLPGPTGEANSLSLTARGTVLCLGPDEDVLMLQVVQALAAGNAVLAVAPKASAALKVLAGRDLPLGIVDGTISADNLETLRIDVVAASFTEERQRAIRQALASREGPIVPLISEAIYPAAYAHERAVCVDTTAAGGNASLLASA
ncbi:bifunctional proline dehydrogenase/L-glutamate gamma-semialdehyde dehydrogenase PutA [Limoniibacter endophyticus]|uniref:Bifunctional protein PutA n=1 Tax=Limoniibacter endophyticus TaxID=1565040 RepID=A0A8J3DTR4_9HYPH|nr:bifunctional proline dehydrogenase/L-glutamate gamma-semialdehyde dehydrogenase PutA [Limoniibacter endophyticus]GHC75714.1 bifunctional protein PutA [Limoniibacter endophyticus]